MFYELHDVGDVVDLSHITEIQKREMRHRLAGNEPNRILFLWDGDDDERR